MEEEEQDQEVPEAPSPVEEDEVVEEADNEEEGGEHISLVLTLSQVHVSILEEAIGNAVMVSQNRDAANQVENQNQFEEAMATADRGIENVASEVGRDSSEDVNVDEERRTSPTRSGQEDRDGMEQKGRVDDCSSVKEDVRVPDIEESKGGEENTNEVKNVEEENARVPEVECCESEQGEPEEIPPDGGGGNQIQIGREAADETAMEVDPEVASTGREDKPPENEQSGSVETGDGELKTNSEQPEENITEETVDAKQNITEDNMSGGSSSPESENDKMVENKVMDKIEISPESQKCVREEHPGVFEMSEAEVGEKSEEKEANDEKSKDILDSLPLLERLRGVSRAGSIRDDASVSGAHSENGGDAASDSCSAATANANSTSRKLRRKETKKAPAKKGGRGKDKDGGALRETKGRGGKVTRSARGKGRRSLAKKKPVKAAEEQPTTVTAGKVYFEGNYFQVGDIVSVTDLEDGDIYYAQLRGFLIDQFAEKSAVISWLLPTKESPPPDEGFHPATYVLGPEEEVPRKLEVFTFVMHAPDDYFYNKRAPYRTLGEPPGGNFTLTRLGPRLRKNVDGKDIYVGLY